MCHSSLMLLYGVRVVASSIIPSIIKHSMAIVYVPCMMPSMLSPCFLSQRRSAYLRLKSTPHIWPDKEKPRMLLSSYLPFFLSLSRHCTFDGLDLGAELRQTTTTQYLHLRHFGLLGKNIQTLKLNVPNTQYLFLSLLFASASIPF